MTELTVEESQNLHAVLGKLGNTLDAIDAINNIAQKLDALTLKIETLYSVFDGEQNQRIADTLELAVQSMSRLTESLRTVHYENTGDMEDILKLKEAVVAIKKILIPNSSFYED